MGAWRQKVALVAPALLALLLVVGVAGAGRARAQTPPLRVAMYGDSVMLGARPALLDQFAGLPVTVDAVEDRSLLGAIDFFRQAGSGIGDVVVLDLGYNDEADPAVFRGRIDDAMTALAGVKQVIWLNQHEWGPGRAAMNAELAAAAGRYPNLDVVDWNAEVAAHPDDVYTDAIHLTPAGQAAMATLVRSEFDRYVASLTPTTTTSTTTTPSTTRPRPGGSGSDRAAPDGIDDSGSSGVGRDLLYGGGAVVLLVAVGGALIVGRRAARRSGRGARRDR